MNQLTDNLQFAIACMMTHSYGVKSLMSDGDLLNKHFKLDRKDAELLAQFISQHADKIHITAMLAEEKRWREMQASIKHTADYILNAELKAFWHRYLHEFSLREPIPQTPGYESIAFLTFLMKQELSMLEKSIVEYELTRNSVLLFEFPDDASVNDEFRVNPSLSIASFDTDICALIRNNQVSMKFDNQRYRVGFLKHAKSGLLKTFKINKTIDDLIDGIKTRNIEKIQPTQINFLIEMGLILGEV